MAARFARNVLGVARSGSASTIRLGSGMRTSALTRRGMSSTANAHGHGHSPKSDKTWIITSGLIFGPAILWIMSPSGQTHNTSHHHGHEDKHENSHPEPKEHEPSAEAARVEEPAAKTSEAPVLVKDDEGKVEDVKESLKSAETDDVPKADPSSNEQHVAETGKPLFKDDSETATLVAEAENALDKPNAEEKEEKEAVPSEPAAASEEAKKESS